MKVRQVCCAIGLTCFLTACANGVVVEESTSTTAPSQQEQVSERETDTTEVVDNRENDKVLVAYFTRLPNTVSGDDLDAVVQGGGPYGAIGDSFETADMDAISSASITVTEDGIKGNVETVAEWIAAYTQGELFSIETVDKYPLDYDTLIDQGGEEQQNNYRPELSTHIEDINEYSVIYLGYPNWYHDMPMALYSFLEEYDMEGKTIIPFAVSAGSGLANTISTIKRLQPDANVIENGLSLRMGAVLDSETEVMNWVDSIFTE